MSIHCAQTLLSHYMSNQTMMSTMSSPVFMIFVLQVDIYKVKGSPEYQFFIVNKSWILNDEIGHYLICIQPFFTNMCICLLFKKSDIKFGIQQ
jgi:hypothetical protein